MRRQLPAGYGLQSQRDAMIKAPTALTATAVARS